MFLAFLESVKFVGHLLPISFLRVFLGYYYFELATTNYRGDFLIRPHIAEAMSEWVPASHAPIWYKFLISTYLIPHWQTVAFVIVGLQFAIAISYLLGYVVRPVALLAVFLSLNMLFFMGPSAEELNKTFIAVHFMFAWIGAGRCLGFDYFFYKRERGIWW